MSLVRNERLQLSANFLNGAGIAVFAVGGLSPVISVLFRTGDSNASLILVAVICTAAAGVLHLLARSLLGGLE